MVDLDWLTNREQSNTLYLVAPLDDQKRLAPVLGGLLGGLTDQAYHLTIAHHANLAARQAAGLGKGS